VNSNVDAVRQRRSIAGAFVGTAIEWYDFYIFGTAAALVFGKVFYPGIAPGSALLASFATLWVGFLTRPIGGAIFGHFGDKIGRKNVLVITLIIMGVATTAIGLLPTYAQIGIAAPILLTVLRACQGIAVGGEWGGAVLIATENASERKKGMAGAWVQQGSPAGYFLATLMFMLVSTLPDEQFISWGWRIPFLFSAILVGAGLVIRLKIEESREFVAAKKLETVVETPILEVFRRVPVILMLGIAASIMATSLAYFLSTFLLSWTTNSLGIDRRTMLNILLGSAVLQFVVQPLGAKLAERTSAQKVMIGGLISTAVLVVPFFLAIQSANPLAITVTVYLSIIGVCAYYALLATTLAAAFPANVRYTGVSLAYQLCSSIVGGSTPLIAQWILNNSNGSPWGVAAFYAVLLAATIAGVWGLRRVVAKHHERLPEAAMSETTLRT